MTRRTITDDQRRARLGRRHRLAPGSRLDRIDDVADAMVALHSSDPVSVFLSAAARLRDGSVEGVEHALYHRRSVVRHHAMRRTLWVFTPENARLAHAASTLGLVGPHRRTLGALLVDSGVTSEPDRWLDDALAAIRVELGRLGQATTRQLGELVPALRAPLVYAPDKPYGGTIAAHTRVLTLLGLMGEIVRAQPTGSWINGQYRWAWADDWVPGGLATEIAPAAATAAIVDRYLRTFGPATADDVQWWLGTTKGATRSALAAAGAVEVALDGGATGWVAADDDDRDDDRDDGAAEPWVALLPGLDPTTMGWKARRWYLPDEHAGTLFDRNGNGGPTIWADGRVVGGWVQRADGTIAWEVFGDLGREHRRLLDAEIERVMTFVGPTRFTTRFPAPHGRQLAAS